MEIVNAGLCTGCRACDVCEHITFAAGRYGFPVPVVDDACRHCGKCLLECIYDPNRETE